MVCTVRQEDHETLVDDELKDDEVGRRGEAGTESLRKREKGRKKEKKEKKLQITGVNKLRESERGIEMKVGRPKGYEKPGAKMIDRVLEAWGGGKG